MPLPTSVLRVLMGASRHVFAVVGGSVAVGFVRKRTPRNRFSMSCCSLSTCPTSRWNSIAVKRSRPLSSRLNQKHFSECAMLVGLLHLCNGLVPLVFQHQAF